jgi:hypothetical protein
VLALITKDDASLADKTINLIPKDIPVVRVETSYTGALADVALLILGFYIAGFAGKVKSIDPGRPGVPRFGSQIYRLNAFGKLQQSSRNSLGKIEEISICRKTRSTVDDLVQCNTLEYWRKGYKDFIEKIQAQHFKAVAFDYDGTLCDGRDRYSGISSRISKHLEKLLLADIVIGIATGRGKSVRKDLQEKLPKGLWPKILIGYYNCSEMSTCDDNSSPNANDTVIDSLKSIADVLIKDPFLQQTCEITLRKKQITIEPRFKHLTETIWAYLQNKINLGVGCECALVRSSHSFDIIPRNVSKCDLIELIQSQFHISPILCIGDKGSFPGNDFSLLRQSYSLSVDEVSSDSESCWNLAPATVRGVQATEKYLSWLVINKKGIKIKIR